MSQGLKVLLTGAPGSGKTTLIRAVVGELDPSRVVGFTTEEIREEGERLGFRVRLLHGKGSGILAHRSVSGGPRVGRYGVEVVAFEELVLPFLEVEPEPGVLYVIDEVGKMECLSPRFARAARRLLEGPAAVLATIPLRGVPFLAKIRAGQQVTTFHVRAGQREEIRREVLNLLGDDVFPPHSPRGEGSGERA